MKTFRTLLLREWMQHKLGWTIAVGSPIAVALIVLAVGRMQFGGEDADVTIEFAAVPALALAVGAIAATAALTLLIAWLIALLQVPGLARRDRQDRSVEFWLSLPTGHVPSLAAPMVAHLLLFPIAALMIGLVSGHLVSLLLVARSAGIGEWVALPWGALLAAAWATALRLVLGIVLATLWLSPLILLAMAASAWLKRWGIPALVVGGLVLGSLLEKLTGDAVLRETVGALVEQAARAFIGSTSAGFRITQGADVAGQLRVVPEWMAHDAGQAIAALANPLLVVALAVSAGCFALLVARRRRGA